MLWYCGSFGREFLVVVRYISKAQSPEACVAALSWGSKANTSQNSTTSHISSRSARGSGWGRSRTRARRPLEGRWTQERAARQSSLHPCGRLEPLEIRIASRRVPPIACKADKPVARQTQGEAPYAARRRNRTPRSPSVPRRVAAPRSDRPRFEPSRRKRSPIDERRPRRRHVRRSREPSAEEGHAGPADPGGRAASAQGPDPAEIVGPLRPL
mmetsp:Transcript_16125/g.49869  ORF Transcript_16125/g.49869 Transcript_16125/m.49869 type:complete len:213 (+) Transcript_16125:146-784(+)